MGKPLPAKQAVTAGLKFISHLDLIRVWQRVFRRAGVALAYSEGFNPHPRLSLAAPLALGVTGEAELMDVYTVQPLSNHAFAAMVAPNSLPGWKSRRSIPCPWRPRPYRHK